MQYARPTTTQTSPINNAKKISVFPQKKRFNRFILSGIKSRLCFHRTHTHTHRLHALSQVKIQLQSLEILERITASRNGYNNPIVVCFFRSNSRKASLAWIYRLIILLLNELKQPPMDHTSYARYLYSIFRIYCFYISVFLWKHTHFNNTCQLGYQVENYYGQK